MVKYLFLLLFPVVGFAQTYNIDRVAYDPNGANDTLYLKQNSDSLYRLVNAQYVFAYRTGHKRFLNAGDISGIPQMVSGVTVKTVNGESILGSGNIAIAGGLPAWGGITGLLSTQTDLQIALNAKLATNGSAALLTGFPTLNQNTTGTAGGLSADIPQSRVTNLVTALAAKQPTGSYLVAADIVGKANITGAFFTGAVGYGTGAGVGGTVIQVASKTTGVILNKLSGQITMAATALAAAAEVSFIVTNSFVAATDVVIVNIQSIGTAGSYFVTVGSVSAGAFTITVGNASTASLSQALVLNFAVIKSTNN